MSERESDIFIIIFALIIIVSSWCYGHKEGKEAGIQKGYDYGYEAGFDYGYDAGLYDGENNTAYESYDEQYDFGYNPPEPIPKKERSRI